MKNSPTNIKIALKKLDISIIKAENIAYKSIYV